MASFTFRLYAISEVSASRKNSRTKSPLADSRAERGRESDIYLVRASAHPRGAFLYNKKSGAESLFKDSVPD